MYVHAVFACFGNVFALAGRRPRRHFQIHPCTIVAIRETLIRRFHWLAAEACQAKRLARALFGSLAGLHACRNPRDINS